MGKVLKAKNLRELTAAELHAKVAEARERLFKLRIAQATHQLNNPANLRLARREIARLLTVANEKERA